VSDTDLASFKDCKSLTYLNLSQTNVTEASLVNFKDCKNLIYLNLSGLHWTGISGGEGLVNFKDCNSLTHLDLNGTRVITGLENFKDSKNLTYLDLSGTNISAVDLVNFKDNKNLIRLFLSRLGWGSTINPALESFSDCFNLRYLDLSHSETDTSGLSMSAFRKLRNLTYLDLSYTSLNEYWLSDLKDFKELKYLYLQKSTIKGNWRWKELADYKDLVYIDMRGTVFFQNYSVVKGLERELPRCRIDY
jgi:uncharacterized protein YjbI with pentapeptide repeats